ncbi:MAG: sugar ABC transporter permease [Oscillospiraceae bacterium]|nr:sugar ABC transporter permease [Oscillospiraceae bacterium]
MKQGNQPPAPALAAGQKKNRIKPVVYLLVLPAMVFLGFFTFYPFLKAIYLSLFVTNPLGQAGAFVGLRNYQRVLTSPDFLRTLAATGKFAGIVGVGTFCLSMFFAYLSVDNSKGSKVYQTMFALPIALSSVPISAIALYILGRNGLLNEILGTEKAWLSTESTALFAVAAVTIWAGVGSSYIFLLVGFRNVDESLVESSIIDGAGYFRRFIKIYVPIASPQIFFVVFLNILHSMKAFALIKLLTGNGPNDSTNVMIYALYSNAFLRGRFETACVYAMVLCLLIFLITRLQFIFEKRAVHYQ